jgi:hypothetical protein
METKPKVIETPTIRCEICLAEIPRSEAVSAEARDYVLHFCGLECYRTWSEGTAARDAPETGKAPGQGGATRPNTTGGGRK